MKLLIVLIVVAFTAYVVYAKPRPANYVEETEQGAQAIVNQVNSRVRRQSPHTKKDFDSLLNRLKLDVEKLGIGFCDGDWNKGIQCFEEDVCVAWNEICDGTQVCGIEKKEDCVNSTKGNEAAPNEDSERENCDGDEHYLWCPLKNYVPTRCGEDITLEAGAYTSVDYLYYDNGMDCFWTVKAAEGQQIVVNFEKFESENNYDFLSLGTGMTEEPDNPGQYIIFKHSGEAPPDPPEFKVESNEIWVRFTSDDWDRKGGFSIEITDSSAKDPGVTLESPFNVEKNKSCGEEISLEADEEKIITSPGFPNYYPNYFECIWTVTAPKGRHIGVGFEYFSLEKNADYLEIGDGSTVGTDTVDKLSGNKIPTQAVTTPSNKAWLKFTSDVANNRLGFKAKVRDQPFNSCGGTIEVPRDGSVIIASPLFPDLGYRINLDCVWSIQGDPERGLTVIFKEFQTEPKYDTVSAGFGAEPSRDGSNYVISGHSGKRLPDPFEFTTSTNTAWIYFKTDNDQIDRGFKLEVYDSAVKESNTTVATQAPLEIDYDCGDRHSVDATTGKIVIQSPGYPGRYRPLLDCTWTVDFEYDANITLKFETFYTETGRDVLSIGTGKDPEDKESVVLDNYGGTIIPAEMRLNQTRYLWLRFLSDFVNQRSGWSLILATVPNSRCGGFFTVPHNGTLVLSSPGYPKYYQPDITCRYTIIGPDNHRLRVSIPEFYTARFDDELSIGEGCRERDPDSIFVVDRHSGIGPPNPSVYLPRSSSVWMSFKVRGLGNRYKGWLATFTDAKITADPRLDDMGMPIVCQDIGPTEAPPPSTPTPEPTDEGGSGWFPYWYDQIGQETGSGERAEDGQKVNDYPDFL